MKGLGALVVVVGLAGCTSVKLQQRDGCWVRRTERLGTVQEDLGPCMRAPSPWSEDRLTRLVQECAVQVDRRWEAAALDAWSHGRAVPPQAGEDSVLQSCLGEALRTVIPENETLRSRLADVADDRDALRASAERDHGSMRESLDQLAEYLGEAAKKASPPAVATATASSEGTQRSDTASAPAAPAAPVVIGTTPTTTGACAPERPGAAARAGRRGGAPDRCVPPRAPDGAAAPGSKASTVNAPAAR